MDTGYELQNALKEFVGKRTPTILSYGIVKSYDADTETIIVTDVINQLDTFNVSLKSVLESDTQSVIVVPKLYSAVIIGSFGDGRFTMLKYSKVEKIKGLIGQLSFDINADGVAITRNGESIKGVLNDLITELTTSFAAIQAAVMVPTNTLKYGLLQTRLNQIFK